MLTWSVIAQQPGCFSDGSVGGYKHSSIAISCKVLRGIKTERGGGAERTASAPTRLAAMCLGRIFENGNAGLPNLLQAGRHSVQMHGNDSLRPRSFSLQTLLRKDVEVIQRDINKDRSCTHGGDRHRRRGRAHGGYQNVLAWPDTDGPQTDFECVRPGTNTDSSGRSAISRKFVLERLNQWTENVAAAGEHATNSAVDLIAKRFVSQSNVIEIHGSQLRYDLNAINRKWRGIRSDIGVEDIFSTHQILHRRNMLVKSTAGFDQPQNASLTKDWHFERRFSGLHHQVAADTIHTVRLGVILQDPKILLWQIVAADPPIHEPLIDVRVSGNDEGWAIFRDKILNLLQS